MAQRAGPYGRSRPGQMMHEHEVVTYWSAEDGAFPSEVPDLPGCAAHGDTREAALDQIGRAVELWVATAREFGDPVPEPRGKRRMPA